MKQQRGTPKSATIRFTSEKSARGFAEKTGGTFKGCHGQESSNFKVQVNLRNAPPKSSRSNSTNNHTDPGHGIYDGGWSVEDED
jgi:hypothetical protein